MMHVHDASGCIDCACMATPLHIGTDTCTCDGTEVNVTLNTHDPVNHPQHYTSHPSGIECIEIVRHMGFNLGNTVKYIWRDGLKDTEVPLQDLKKALWYLQDEITMREKRDN